jgi:hypothetical protein
MVQMFVCELTVKFSHIWCLKCMMCYSLIQIDLGRFLKHNPLQFVYRVCLNSVLKKKKNVYTGKLKISYPRVSNNILSS